MIWVPGAFMQVEGEYTRKEKGWNEAHVEGGTKK